MRLNVSRSKNSASLYVIKSTWENKVHSTVIVEKLGTEAELREKLNGRDPYEWAKEYIAELNRQEKEGKDPPVIAKYSPASRLEKDAQQSFHGGYLFLQRLYYELGFPKICDQITKKHTAMMKPPFRGQAKSRSVTAPAFAAVHLNPSVPCPAGAFAAIAPAGEEWSFPSVQA